MPDFAADELYVHCSCMIIVNCNLVRLCSNANNADQDQILISNLTVL